MTTVESRAVHRPERRPATRGRSNGSTSRRSEGKGLLSVLGAINWDISLFQERFARPGEEVPVRRVEEFSGGKGGNVAVAAARILGPGKAAFVGALGDDAICDAQIEELIHEGVVADGVIRMKGVQSGRAYIIIDNQGKKTIHTHFGANERITPELLEGSASSILEESKVVVAMDHPTPVSEVATRIAKDHGAMVLYSPGVRTREGIEKLEGVLSNSDFLVLDRIELMNLHRTDDEREAATRVCESYPHVAVVATLGAEGCMILSRDGVAQKVRGFDAAELGRSVLNTTGCGDAFLGVFASYLMMGKSPLEAARLGNLAGALKATRLETRGSPKKAELEAALNITSRLGRT